MGFSPPEGGGSDPMTTRGDIIIRDASNDTARLAVGGAGEALLSDGTDIAWGAITATAAGAATQVQFNTGGALDAEAAFTYNKTTNTLTAVNMAAAFTGNVSGSAATVTGATQASITTVANVTTVGALNAGSITSGFTSIDVGSGTIDGGVITADTNFAGDLTGDVTGNCSGTSGSTTGNAATVTNATFTTALTVDVGTLTLTANIANSSVLTIGAGASSVSGANTGDQTNVTGTSATVTGATQAAITTCANLVTVGALNAGSITSGFTSIDVGAGAIGTSGAISGGTLAVVDATGLTLGTASSAVGGMILQNATNANTLTINSGVVSSSYTITMPLAVPGAGEALVDAGGGDGVLAWAAAGGGNTLDGAYDEGGAGVGKAITVDSGAVALSGGSELLTLVSTATTGLAMSIIGDSLTADAGRASLLDVYSDSSDNSTRNLVKITNDNTGASGTFLLSLDQDAAESALFIAQSAAAPAIEIFHTGNNNALYANYPGATGTIINVEATGLTSGKAIQVTGGGSNIITSGNQMLLNWDSSTSATTATTSSGVNIRTNAEKTYQGSATISDDYDANYFYRLTDNSSTGTYNAAGSILKLETASINDGGGSIEDTTKALEIVHAVNASADTYAISIIGDNAGAGAPGGIDMSSFATGEALINVPVDTGAVGAHYGRVAVNVTGVGIKYIDLFEAS